MLECGIGSATSGPLRVLSVPIHSRIKRPKAGLRACHIFSGLCLWLLCSSHFCRPQHIHQSESAPSATIFCHGILRRGLVLRQIRDLIYFVRRREGEREEQNGLKTISPWYDQYSKAQGMCLVRPWIEFFSAKSDIYYSASFRLYPEP